MCYDNCTINIIIAISVITVVVSTTKCKEVKFGYVIVRTKA